MKKYTLKSLTCAITSVMAMIALSTQSARAADTEIYRASTSGETTLMLLLDISGSMNLGYSALEDYNLTAGDPPQDSNLKVSFFCLYQKYNLIQITNFA